MNLSYKGRQRLKNLLTALAFLAVAAVLVGAVWLLWLDRYVIYTRDGAKLDFSHSSKELEGDRVALEQEKETVDIYFNEGEQTLQTTGDLKQLSGYYIDAKMLTDDFDGVLDTLDALPSGTPVMLEVKDVTGRFYYTTSLGNNHKGLDTARVDQLISRLCGGKFYAIARFPAFREYAYAVEHVNHGLSSTKGAYLYLDPGRCYWLNPASSGAMNFVQQEISEIKALGFDEVVLADFRFPDTDQIDFKGDRTETLNAAALNLAETYTSNRFALSFEVTDKNFVLPQGRTRLYRIDCLAEDAKKVAEESGLENTAIQLVFTTELLDTRFSPYGVLRPITSAHIDGFE